jgi:hypothetical protein
LGQVSGSADLRLNWLPFLGVGPYPSAKFASSCHVSTCTLRPTAAAKIMTGVKLVEFVLPESGDTHPHLALSCLVVGKRPTAPPQPGTHPDI